MAKKDETVASPKSGPRFEIQTPFKGFSGERFGVKFREGVGHCDSIEQADACASSGYTVIDAHKEDRSKP